MSNEPKRTSETLRLGKGSRKKIEVSNFDSIEALLDYIKNTERQPRNAERQQSEKNDNDFNGGDSYEVALGKTMNGCEKTLAKVEAFVEKIKAVTCVDNSTRWTSVNDVVGDCWDMGAVTQGIPECAISTQSIADRQDNSLAVDKVISICLSICVSASVNPSAIQRRGAALVATVDALESFGVRCEVRVELGSGWQPEGNAKCTHSLMTLKVKDAGQPLETSRLAYLVGHAGFFRRIGFAWMERLQDCKLSYSYGSVCDIRTQHDDALVDAGYDSCDIRFGTTAGNHLNVMSEANWSDYVIKILAERGITIDN